MMSLTIKPGPLADKNPATGNYHIEGPAHLLLMHDFPRRVRAVFAGETVLDSEGAKILHETGLPPQLYVPIDDLRSELLKPTDHHTHCPFKGDASYWSVVAGDRTAENAIWTYAEPNPESAWLRGYAGPYWGSMDAWYDEDEEINGLRDPYHRVDVRDTSRHVRVTVAGEVIAETDRPRVLSETGLPNRFYIPPEDVRSDLLVPTGTHTVCPYKGTASYWSVNAGGGVLTDAVWSYPEAEGDSAKARGYFCFGHDDVAVEAGPPR
jgi:uncharacterized protein (DUF427 family)